MAEAAPLTREAALARMGAGAALLSTTGILVALAHVPPAVSAFWRMLLGGAMLAAGLLFGGRLSWPDARTLGYSLLPALAFAADLSLWHRSIAYVGPGLATLLANFQVFLMALVGWAVYRERLGLRFLLGLGVALLGLWLLVGAQWSLFDATHRAGVWLGLATGFAYAVYLLGFRHALSGRVRAEPAQFLATISVLCALLLLGECLLERAPLAMPDLQTVGALVALAYVGQVLAWMLIVRAMPRLPASQVGLLLLLQPALAYVMDVLLFHRHPDADDWLGLALSLAGIFLGSTRPSPRAEAVDA